MIHFNVLYVKYLCLQTNNIFFTELRYNLEEMVIQKNELKTQKSNQVSDLILLTFKQSLLLKMYKA